MDFVSIVLGMISAFYHNLVTVIGQQHDLVAVSVSLLSVVLYFFIPRRYNHWPDMELLRTRLSVGILLLVSFVSLYLYTTAGWPMLLLAAFLVVDMGLTIDDLLCLSEERRLEHQKYLYRIHEMNNRSSKELV